MKRFWQILALLLLALMVPATVCCLGVKISTEQHCDCCGEPEHEPSAPALPECASDTIAHSHVPVPVTLPPTQMVELTDIIHSMVRLNELTAVLSPPGPLMTTAPPELRVIWVFVSRAALPARAPSELA